MTMHLPRHLRRSTAFAAAAVLLSAPLLFSCGFSPATDRINIISVGINDRSGNIDVLGAVVVAPADNTGTFVATLANNLTGDGQSDTLVSLTTGDNDVHMVTANGTLPRITIAPTASFSMIGRGLGIPVIGSFSVGEFVTVTLGFQSGQTTTMTVPVVRPCFAYAAVTPAPVVGGAPTDSASPLQLPSPSTPAASVEPDGGNNDPYTCAQAVRPTDVPSQAQPVVP